jgi:aspartate beta-hydroxylase
MIVEAKHEALDRAGLELWQKTQSQYPASKLDRMETFFEVARGRLRPVTDDPRRELHPHLFVPGLLAQPWWNADMFPLATWLRSRHDLIAHEARTLLAKPWVFAQHPGNSCYSPTDVSGSPLKGRWCCYYLQRHLRRISLAAEHAPVALRSLDGVPAAREALLSFLGPQSRIKTHSDKVNFVLTLYLPLFAQGAWISFAGERRQWVDGQCVAADSTFFHESVNDGPVWRGLMLVDLWHPGLTATERMILECAAPVINDILRSSDSK